MNKPAENFFSDRLMEQRETYYLFLILHDQIMPWK